MYSLRIENEQGEIRRIDVSGDSYSIGRLKDNDLVLPDINVSRRHAVIEVRPDGLVLVDNGSKYGIRMHSSQNPREVVLQGGDVFIVGDYKIELIPSEADVMPVAAATIRMAAVHETEPASAPEPVPVAAVSLLKEAVGVPYTVAVSEDESLKVLLEMRRRSQTGSIGAFDLDDGDPFQNDVPTDEERRSNMTRVIMVALLVAATAVIGWLLYSYWADPDLYLSMSGSPESTGDRVRGFVVNLLS